MTASPLQRYIIMKRKLTKEELRIAQEQKLRAKTIGSRKKYNRKNKHWKDEE